MVRRKESLNKGVAPLVAKRGAMRFDEGHVTRGDLGVSSWWGDGEMDGFLGTRASLGTDVVVVAMMLVVPAMLASIALVKYRAAFRAHRNIQVTLAVALLICVVLFEVDIRLHGWTHRAEASRFYVEGRWNDAIEYALAIHLCFAIPVIFLWGMVITRALRRFPRPPAPGEHSASHRFWGRFAAIWMTLTAITGWTFYWIAFVA